MAARENGWQFDALDLRAVLGRLNDTAGWLGSSTPQISPVGSTRQVDLYFDTEDLRFHRAGYSLRIRRVNRRRHAEATLETLESATAAGNLQSRPVISQPVEAFDARLLAVAGGPVTDRVRAVAGKKASLAVVRDPYSPSPLFRCGERSSPGRDRSRRNADPARPRCARNPVAPD